MERTKKEVGKEAERKGSLPLERRPAEKESRPEEDIDEKARKRRVQGLPTSTPPPFEPPDFPTRETMTVGI